MNPGDMHQMDEPADAPMRLVGFIITYASGFLMGALAALWWVLA
jgi:hypothetical protein